MGGSGTQWGAKSVASRGTGPQVQVALGRNAQETLRRKGLTQCMSLLGTRAPGEGI